MHIPIPEGRNAGRNKGPPVPSKSGHSTFLPQAGRLFDHGGTVFFSLFMALWAVLLLEYWKRKSATLAYRWDCSDYEDIEVSHPRWTMVTPGEGRH